MSNFHASSDSFEVCMDRIQSATKAYTQIDLAELLNIRQSSISDAKKRNSIPAKWLITLLQKHRLNPDWILIGELPQYLGGTSAETDNHAAKPISTLCPPKRIKNKSIIVHALCGSGKIGSPWEQKPVEQIVIPEHFYKKGMIAVLLESASLEPMIRKGSYIGIDTMQKKLISGELYVFDFPKEGLVIRNVYIREDESLISLTACSPHFQEQHIPFEFGQKKVFGKVFWVFQEV